MTDPVPFMTEAEIALLNAHLKPFDHAWEWGSGDSTLWLAKRVSKVTSVEHQTFYAARATMNAPRNTSVIFAPPDGIYSEGTDDDGTFDCFRRYVSCFDGRGITAILIDGRARVACARWVVECAQFGPNPDTRIFLHDAHRRQYEPIWKDDPETGWKSYFTVVERAENLLVLSPRFDR